MGCPKLQSHTCLAMRGGAGEGSSYRAVHRGKQGRGAVIGPYVGSTMPDSARMWRRSPVSGCLEALDKPSPATGSPHPTAPISKGLCDPLGCVSRSPIPALGPGPPGRGWCQRQHWAGEVGGHPPAGLCAAAQPMGHGLARGLAVSGHRWWDGQRKEQRQERGDLEETRCSVRRQQERAEKAEDEHRATAHLRSPFHLPSR